MEQRITKFWEVLGRRVESGQRTITEKELRDFLISCDFALSTAYQKAHELLLKYFREVERGRYVLNERGLAELGTMTLQKETSLGYTPEQIFNFLEKFAGVSLDDESRKILSKKIEEARQEELLRRVVGAEKYSEMME